MRRALTGIKGLGSLTAIARRGRYILARCYPATVAGKPSVIVATLPKSGTKYVGSTLSKSLGYATGRSLYTGRFPNNRVLPEVAAEFARGGMAISAHIQCTASNMATLLEAGIDRMVLHVRDPRATLYSWAHYARTRNLLRERLGENFFYLSEEEQIDHHIGEFFARSVQWLIEWADHLDSGPEMRVLTTSYEQLARDEETYFQSIFEFYGLSPHRLATAPKDASVNYRSGRVDEWREAVSPAQIGRMTASIPERLFQRFGWMP